MCKGKEMEKIRRSDLATTSFRLPPGLLDAVDRVVEQEREEQPHLAPSFNRSAVIRAAVANYLEQRAASVMEERGGNHG